MGPLEDSAAIVYLRPETAQGIYVNFLNVQQAARQKIPFGIAQIGKAFRNEITPGNFIFRTREFEQMEMQFFVKPGTDMEWFEKWKAMRIQWHLDNGIRKHKLRFHEHGPGELAHYAKAAFDIEYEFPFGWQELEGIHNRSDFDLGRHQQFSGKKLEYFDEEAKERYLPYIVETSAGCDRSLLVALVDAYRFDGDRTWLEFHPALAPYKVAVYPAHEEARAPRVRGQSLSKMSAERFRATTDDAGSIGKRYRRQDEIGTPFGVTIDYDTLSNHTVTIRHRDTMAQERISAENLVRLHRREIRKLAQVKALRPARTLRLLLRRRQGRRPRGDERAARRKGREPPRDDQARTSRPSRLHDLDRSLHALLRQRQDLSEGARSPGQDRARASRENHGPQVRLARKTRFSSPSAPARAPRCPA